MRKKADSNAVLQSIRGAAEITGLSVRYLREGCKSGTIPHVMVGTDYRIHLPLLLEQLAQQAGGGNL